MFCPARTNVTDNVLEESGGERGGVKITVGTENIVGGLEPRKKTALSSVRQRNIIYLIDGFDKCRYYWWILLIGREF